MNAITSHPIRRGAVLAVALLTTAGAADAAAAQQPALKLQSGALQYIAEGDVDDVVVFDPGSGSGRRWIDVRANLAMTVEASAAGICSGGGVSTIRCDATGLTAVSAGGSDGDDTITLLPSAAGDPALRLAAGGDAGDDTIKGAGEDDLLGGGPGSDTLHGGAGDDTIAGNGGADLVYADAGDDIVHGDDDDFSGAPSGGPAVPAEPGGGGTKTLKGGGLSFAATDPGGDTLLGGSGADLLDGGAGDDAISAGEGDDSAVGGEGDDAVSGGGDDDTLGGGGGDDTTDGGEGDDDLVGDLGSDLLDGGPGVDEALYGDRTDPLTLTLDDSGARQNGGIGDGPAGRRDAITTVERLWGGIGGDLLVALRAGGELHGGAGEDTLTGSDGTDVLAGDGGADALDGRGGIDAYFGGDGDDRLRTADGVVEPNVNCGAGSADRLVRDGGDGADGCETTVLPDAGDPSVSPPATPGVPAPPSLPGTPPSPPIRTVGDAPRPRLAVGVEIAVARVAGRGGRAGARVTRIRVSGLPAGTTVTLTCAGRARTACPVRRVVRRSGRTPRARIDLSAAFRGRVVPAGTVLELRVTKPGTTGLLRRVTVRGGRRAPLRQALCLTPGSVKPVGCAA